MVRDSIRIEMAGLQSAGIVAVPGSPWIILSLVKSSLLQHRIIDRQGREVGRITGPLSPVRPSGDALWQSGGGEAIKTITRTPLDPSSGRPGSRTDTVYVGCARRPVS